MAVAAALAVAACGGSTSDDGGTSGAGASAGSGGGAGSGGSSGAGGSGGSGGAAGDGGAGGGAMTDCPAQPPSGGVCTKDGLQCSYGTSIDPECRALWSCSGGSWAGTGAMCPQPPPSICGNAPPMDGTVCATNGDVCTYAPGTICVCTNCLGGPCQAGAPKWHCAPPPTTAGCPTIAPNVGTACDAEGLACTYGNPCSGSGAHAVCKSGAWVWDQVVCAQ